MFDRPLEDWTLRELEVAAGVAGQMRDEAVARGDHGQAARYQAWALEIAEARDARRGLERAMEDATFPEAVNITDLLALEDEDDQDDPL